MEPKGYEKMWWTKQPYKQQTSYDLYISFNNIRHLLLRSSLHFTTLHPPTKCPIFRDKWRVVTARNASTLTVHFLTLHYLKVFEVFILCAPVQQSIAPTNNNPVISSLASSPPHYAIRGPKPRGSSRGRSSVQGIFVPFIIRVKNAASKL